MLPKFFLALQKSNLENVVEWKYNRQFDSEIIISGRVIWRFDHASKRFNSYKPIISVDWTHLFIRFSEKLLIVVDFDADNRTLPLVYALVEEKNNINWRWFL